MTTVHVVSSRKINVVGRGGAVHAVSSRRALNLKAPGSGIVGGDKGDVNIFRGIWHFERTNGSPGDGVQDDAPYLTDLLAAGRTVVLSDRKSYLLKTPLIGSVAGTGITAPLGAIVRMSMAAGAFDNDVAADRSSITTAGGKKYAVGIYASGVEGFFLKGFELTTTAWTDHRYLRPVYLDGCDDALIEGLNIHLFSRVIGLIGFRDCDRITVRKNRLHHAYTLSAFESDGTTPATGSTVQITGIEGDDGAVTGSKDFRILENEIWMLTNGAAILAALGNVQSDAINVKGTDDKSSGGEIVANAMRDCAEGIDLFAWRTLVAKNAIRSMFGAGIKFFHGASYNLAESNLIDDCGLACIYTGGSNASSNNSKGNQFKANSLGRVNRMRDWIGADGAVFFDSLGGTRSFWTDVYASGVGTITAGIRCDVLAGGTSQCEGAVFEGNDMDLGGNADRGIFMEGGAGGLTNYVRGKPRVVGLKTDGRQIQDSSNYLVFEGFAPDTLTQIVDRAAFVADGSSQAIFDASATGAYAVQNGERYRVHIEVLLNGLSSSSSTFSFDLGGTATFPSGGIALQAFGGKSAGVGIAYGTQIRTTSATIVVSASTSTEGKFIVTGTMQVNAGGTIIPMLHQSAGSAATVLAGSFMSFTRISAHAAIGNFE